MLTKAELPVTASGHELGVVNSAVYAGGSKVADVPIEEAGEWSKRPGHVVWIGLIEPSDDLLQRVQRQFDLHPLAIEDAAKAHRHPKLEQYGHGIFIVARTAQMVEGRIAFGETHLFVGRGYVVPPRRFRLLCCGAPALRGLSDRSVAGRGLHRLCNPRLHRRQLHAGSRENPLRSRGDRGYGAGDHAQSA